MTYKLNEMYVILVTEGYHSEGPEVEKYFIPVRHGTMKNLGIKPEGHELAELVVTDGILISPPSLTSNGNIVLNNYLTRLDEINYDDEIVRVCDEKEKRYVYGNLIRKIFLGEAYNTHKIYI